MGGWGVGEAQSVFDQLVEISIADVCSYRDQNFSTANDLKETDVPLTFGPASFAPRLIFLAALSLQSNMFSLFDSNPCHMTHVLRELMYFAGLPLVMGLSSFVFLSFIFFMAM